MKRLLPFLLLVFIAVPVFGQELRRNLTEPQECEDVLEDRKICELPPGMWFGVGDTKLSSLQENYLSSSCTAGIEDAYDSRERVSVIGWTDSNTFRAARNMRGSEAEKASVHEQLEADLARKRAEAATSFLQHSIGGEDGIPGTIFHTPGVAFGECGRTVTLYRVPGHLSKEEISQTIDNSLQTIRERVAGLEEDLETERDVRRAEDAVLRAEDERGRKKDAEQDSTISLWYKNPQGLVLGIFDSSLDPEGSLHGKAGFAWSKEGFLKGGEVGVDFSFDYKKDSLFVEWRSRNDGSGRSLDGKGYGFGLYLLLRPEIRGLSLDLKYAKLSLGLLFQVSGKRYSFTRNNDQHYFASLAFEAGPMLELTIVDRFGLQAIALGRHRVYDGTFLVPLYPDHSETDLHFGIAAIVRLF